MSRQQLKILIWIVIGVIIILSYILFYVSSDDKPKEYKVTEYTQSYAEGITLYWYVLKSDSKFYSTSSTSPITNFKGINFDYLDIDTNNANKIDIIIISTELRNSEYESINKQINILNE